MDLFENDYYKKSANVTILLEQLPQYEEEKLTLEEENSEEMKGCIVKVALKFDETKDDFSVEPSELCWTNWT